MQRKVVAPLLVALIVCVMVLVTGCSKKNHNPVLGAIAVTPADTVAPGGDITLKVTATDEDNDSLTFTWTKTTAGTLSPTTGDSVVWTAPTAAATCTLTVVCADGADGADTATKVVYARGWMTSSIDGFTPDSTYLPNTGTTEVPFTWDTSDTLKPGAIVDSIAITLGFDDPDTLALEQFDLYLVSPHGTEVLLYDGVDLNTLDLSQYGVTGFAGEAVTGTWKLKFVRNNSQGYNGVVEDCDLDVDYKY